MNHPDRSAVVDLALGLSGENELRAHLRTCRACGEELERIVERHGDLERSYGAMPQPSTEALEAKILGAVRAAAPRPALRALPSRFVALAAASLVMAAVIGWAIATRPPKVDLPIAPEPVSGQEPAPPAPEDVAARINGEILTWRQVAEALKGIKPSDITDELRNSFRRQLAEAMLFRQFAQRKKITVSEAEVERQLETDARTYGSPEEYERVVRIRYGSAAKAREVRREELVAFRVLAYVRQNEKTDPDLREAGFLSEEIPESECRKYYDANTHKFDAIERISFMRVGITFTGPEDEDSKRALAESVLRKYQSGAEFAMLAFYYSDVRRAKDFRDLGVTRKDLQDLYAPETVAYLFDTLKEGEVSPLVKDRNTLNLFKMEQKIRQAAEPFDEAQHKIRAMLENQVREENRKKFRDLLRRHARIEPADLFGEK